jgi:RNA polymerase sigma-70 factor (ECF subfamily)
MLAMLRNVRQIETDVPNIGGWLRSVVEFKAIDHFRKQIRNRDRLHNLVAQPVVEQNEPSPSASLESGETRDRVLDVLGKLPVRQREVLECKYLDGLSVRDIATRLGETEKSIESLLYRGRREFRRLFELPAASVSSVPQRQIGSDVECQP